MSEKNFYQEIEHSPVPWRQYQLHIPLFYQDIRFLSISILAPLDNIKSILPSERLKPYRVTPWQGVVSFTAYEYRESDIGPYNEVSIGIPVTLDEETPIFTGILRKMPETLLIYSHHLPVTTEIAREVGYEFAGYPKFIADIEFTKEDDWINCELRTESQHILTLSGRHLTGKIYPRFRVHPITYRNGYMLRSELVMSEREMGSSNRAEDVKIELGDHSIAEEIKGLKLGRMLGYRYCPYAQGILTPVIESFSGS